MKSLARMRHLQLRNSLSEKEIEKKSSAIMENLFSMREIQNAKTILFYASFGSEVSTTGMIEKAFSLGKTVCVPITSFKDKTIKIGKITSLEELEKKPNGLIEPKKPREVQLNEIEVIIVPGVAFDKDGYRIGYGGGFYDKLLNKAPRRIVSIGLCFEQNIDLCLPRQSHDAKVAFVITEERVINCKG